MSLSATQKLARAKSRIRAKGEALTVTRRASTGGETPTTQIIYFLPQTQASPGGSIGVEGIGNATEPNEYDFECAGDADVQAVIDTITFAGGAYKVNNVNPTREGGVNITLHCFAIRQS